jgi:hypothetical protein
MSRVVRAFHDSDVEREWRRLAEPVCQIEFASTLRLVEKYFPPARFVTSAGGQLPDDWMPPDFFEWCHIPTNGTYQLCRDLPLRQGREERLSQGPSVGRR